MQGDRGDPGEKGEKGDIGQGEYHLRMRSFEIALLFLDLTLVCQLISYFSGDIGPAGNTSVSK